MCVEGQDILGNNERMAKVLSLVPDDQLRQDIEREMNKHTTSLPRWHALTAVFQNAVKKVSPVLSYFLNVEICSLYCFVLSISSFY